MEVNSDKTDPIKTSRGPCDITMSTNNQNNDLNNAFSKKKEHCSVDRLMEMKVEESACQEITVTEPEDGNKHSSVQECNLEKQLDVDNASSKKEHEQCNSTLPNISDNKTTRGSHALTLKDSSNIKQNVTKKDNETLKKNNRNANKVCPKAASDTQKCKIKKTVQKKTSGALSQLLDYGMSDSEDSESDSVSLSESSDTDSILSDEIVVKSNKEETAIRSREFRENDSSSENSTTYYESDSSSDSSEIVGACGITPTVTTKKPVPKMNTTVTRGELTLEDLPLIDELQISVPEQECIEIGIVTSIVEQLVIVQSLPGSPAFDIDTLLFLDRGLRPLGRIFDVLGPVTEPFYAVRFNSYEQAVEAGAKPGTPVYSAPHNSQHTAYVFVSELLKMKGSDASWKHNNEPPEIFLDYSDDEQERQARKLRRPGKSSILSENPNSNSLERNKKFERQMNDKNKLMSERYNQPSTSRKQHVEPEKKSFQPMPNLAPQWAPAVPRPMPRPEFCLPPYQYGYFNQYGSFPMMPQFGMPNSRQPCIPPLMGPPSMFHAPQPFNPNIPPPIIRPQPVPYFPNPRHPRWVPPTNGVLQPPRGNFGNGSFTQ